jgi:DNA polymerase I-like protein with 3'-5' exonuclease and polymerase domains
VRLIICDGEPADIQSALGHLDAPGASVLINPKWLTPDPNERLWIACGAPALKMLQGAGWLPKKGGVEANRGKLFTGVQPEGWVNPINVGVTYAPQIYHIDYGDFVAFQTDIALYRRFEATGSMQPKLGHYTYAEDLSGVIRYLKARYALTGQPVELALDTETEGLDPFNPTKRIVCIQASAKEGIADVVYVLHDHVGFAMEEPGAWLMTKRLETIVGQLQWIASQPWIKVIGANFKYDMLWLRVKYGIVFQNFAFDTCNGGSLCEENRANTLNLHTKIYSPELGGYDDDFNRTYDKSKMGAVPKPALLPYAGGDTDACLRNYRQIRKELLADNVAPNGKPAKNSLASLYMNIVHPTLKALHKMEYTGVCVDVDRFHAFGADLEARMNESMAHAAAVLPKHLIDKYGGLTETGGAPLSKPNMIAEFLFSPTGLNLKPLQTTEKTGAPSTSEYHLAQFKDHPDAAAVIERYLDYKSVSKMHGTYYVGFLSHLRADNRWHPSYIIHRQGGDKDNEQAAAGTVTGRGSATAPAFQCVTGDTEIMTPAGIRPAGEIIDPLIPPTGHPYRAHVMDLWGSSGWQQTSNVFRSWRTDIVRVRFANGNELECTPEHPILTFKAGFVRAKDLTEDHYLTLPPKVERAPAPEWCTPDVAEAIGIVMGAGRISARLPVISIELPKDLAEWVHAVVASDLHETGKLEDVDGASVLSFAFREDMPLALKLFFLALPDAGSLPIPFDLRGTTCIHDLLRGLLRAAGGFRTTKAGNPLAYVETPRRDLAVALLRETLMDGNPSVSMEALEGRYRVQWRGYTAKRLTQQVGLPQPGWDPREPSSYGHRAYPSLRVVGVEPAGSGWVYDFTVPGTHDFLANSMIVHNTVPKHSYWGKRLRECIIAPPGHVIVARDYSQGELKVAACWAGETKMIHAYKSGIDLHVLTAATVNGMSYEEAMFLKKADPDRYDALRQNGKAGNFGLLYGMSAYGFMMYADAVYGVKLTIEEAEAMRDAYFDLYPGLLLWHDRQIQEARVTGQVRSPLGRVRHLPGINSPIKAVRKGVQNQAINSPIQGTLVDMMWWSMGIIEAERPDLLIPFGQVHDQGLWYAPEDRVDEAIAYSGGVMEDLPFEKQFGWKPELVFNTDAEVGSNLASLKKIAKAA